MGFDSKLGAVLEPLYAAVLDAGRLSDFSSALCTATGSHIGAVMAHDAGNRGGRLDLLVGADPAYMAPYEREFASDNPWMQRSAHCMRRGAVVDSDAVLAREELRRTRYYNEYLRIGDVEQSVALCAQADADGVVVATLCRSRHLAPYSEDDLALMRQVAPHWANAYAIQRRLSWLEDRVQTLESAVDIAPTAMLLLDARQQVLRMNAAAEAVLAHGDVLRLERRCPEAIVDAAALRRLLARAASGTDEDGRRLRHAGRLVLRDASGRNALAASAHPCGATGRADGATAVLFLQPLGAQSDLATTLRQLFGLAPPEAALAAALQRHGDLAAAAAACGITIATAQTRIRLVCDKTGERGQPALVRLLSAVAVVCG